MGLAAKFCAFRKQSSLFEGLFYLYFVFKCYPFFFKIVHYVDKTESLSTCHIFSKLLFCHPILLTKRLSTTALLKRIVKGRKRRKERRNDIKQMLSFPIDCNLLSTHHCSKSNLEVCMFFALLHNNWIIHPKMAVQLWAIRERDSK